MQGILGEIYRENKIKENKFLNEKEKKELINFGKFLNYPYYGLGTILSPLNFHFNIITST